MKWITRDPVDSLLLEVYKKNLKQKAAQNILIMVKNARLILLLKNIS